MMLRTPGIQKHPKQLKEKAMKNFFTEFKKFITRGNVVDMAVGVLVGSSFTAIVNGLSNFILKPIINYLLALIFGANSLSELYTFLKKVEIKQDILNEAGEVIGSEIVPDLTQSIYIDWGSFINAIINFFLIALVLFSIVKLINKLRDERNEFNEKLVSGKLTKEQKAELKSAGIKKSNKAAVDAYFAEKQKKAEEAAAAQAAADAEAARLAREANPTTEDLLKQILAEMKKA
ncbi:MAG: large conductance mechanosensitive channel protein MscL [Ruminococcaceae bacterium]|nr:large conductance mechanosensitive channel protein MscL [Oscillospiraceae bacterium]